MTSSSTPPIALAGTSLTLDEAIAAFAGLDRQCEFTDIAACLSDSCNKQLPASTT